MADFPERPESALPNLAVKRIIATPSGTAGTRVLIDGMGPMEPAARHHRLAARQRSYTGDRGSAVEFLWAESRRRGQSYAIADTTVYAAPPMAGLISRDGGASFTPTNHRCGQGAGGAIFVDPARPNMALAAVAAPP